jgi:hypothetical protein
MAEAWISTAEAVKLTGYSTVHIQGLARQGKIKARKWVSVWQISKTSLLAYKRQADKLGGKRGPKVARA